MKATRAFWMKQAGKRVRRISANPHWNGRIGTVAKDPCPRGNFADHQKGPNAIPYVYVWWDPITPHGKPVYYDAPGDKLELVR